MSTSLRNLAEADDLCARDVGDVALAEERQQVVLAQAVEIDVLDDHHLAVVDGEQRVVEHFVDVHVVAARQELEGLFDALRGIRAALRGPDLLRARRGAAVMSSCITPNFTGSGSGSRLRGVARVEPAPRNGRRPKIGRGAGT